MYLLYYTLYNVSRVWRHQFPGGFGRGGLCCSMFVYLSWGDGNGHSHIRAALLGASLTVPFASGRMMLGTWQQIIHVDFDTRPRQRELVLQLIGE